LTNWLEGRKQRETKLQVNARIWAEIVECYRDFVAEVEVVGEHNRRASSDPSIEFRSARIDAVECVRELFRRNDENKKDECVRETNTDVYESLLEELQSTHPEEATCFSLYTNSRATTRRREVFKSNALRGTGTVSRMTKSYRPASCLHEMIYP
jgi:hypothetical protein